MGDVAVNITSANSVMRLSSARSALDSVMRLSPRRVLQTKQVHGDPRPGNKLPADSTTDSRSGDKLPADATTNLRHGNQLWHASPSFTSSQPSNLPSPTMQSRNGIKSPVLPTSPRQTRISPPRNTLRSVSEHPPTHAQHLRHSVGDLPSAFSNTFTARIGSNISIASLSSAVASLGDSSGSSRSRTAAYFSGALQVSLWLQVCLWMSFGLRVEGVGQ